MNASNHISAALAATLAAGTMFLTGCKTATPAAEGEKAVTCSKCQTTWVYRPYQINKTVVYSREKTMVCPDCAANAEGYFRTGALAHSCKTCREGMTVCPAPCHHE